MRATSDTNIDWHSKCDLTSSCWRYGRACCRCCIIASSRCSRKFRGQTRRPLKMYNCFRTCCSNRFRFGHFGHGAEARLSVARWRFRSECVFAIRNGRTRNGKLDITCFASRFTWKARKCDESTKKTSNEACAPRPRGALTRYPAPAAAGRRRARKHRWAAAHAARADMPTRDRLAELRSVAGNGVYQDTVEVAMPPADSFKQFDEVFREQTGRRRAASSPADAAVNLITEIKIREWVNSAKVSSSAGETARVIARDNARSIDERIYVDATISKNRSSAGVRRSSYGANCVHPASAARRITILFKLEVVLIPAAAAPPAPRKHHTCLRDR
ncbi:hypothetical protein EVAR_33536_1 [Eumeta japonica]|uniref:Uncharacterized protein n=1 Tax=Eumeta variegata TaxID=151549 RepID=A0A4C1VKG6_EUMVA|nr:hypothetical protein EVAR_33536_1 [Eumeta japonica]